MGKNYRSIGWGDSLAGNGTIGVGAGGEEQKASEISIFRLPWLAFFITILFFFNGWLHFYKRQRREQELMEFEVVEEIIYGLESGILFGMASVISKTGFLFLEQGFHEILVPICILISICCSATGFYYQTRGLKHGRAIVVSTCAAVASIITGVVAGMLALGEELPSSPTARLFLLLGWLLIIVGVILLVSSSRLIRRLTWLYRRFKQSGTDRNFGHRSGSSVRIRDSSPSAIIQTTTLQNLLSSKAKADS
ncbi:putative magnesium transporter NIPA9, partial [Cucurbita argyrosperma subsp. argyrosperma]